jgi:hypothetical protein
MTKRESLHKTAEAWGYQVESDSASPVDSYQGHGHRLVVKWTRNHQRVMYVLRDGQPVFGGYFAAFYLLNRQRDAEYHDSFYKEAE